MFVTTSTLLHGDLTSSDGADAASATADRATRERVDEYAILSTERDAAFDRVVFTAAQMFRVPIAIVALQDGERLWFKAQVGLGITEVPSTIAFCSAITHSSPLVVEDATTDPRFADNPLVTASPNIRFYAGAPLITPDGIRVGSLCVVDRSPKILLARQMWQLTQLAQSVVSILEQRRST